MAQPTATPPGPGELPWLLDCRPASSLYPWRELRPRWMIAAVGEDSEEERAAMLLAGFGEALSSRVAVTELALRLSRLSERASALPRYRRAGPALLDLFHRDARIGSRWLSLHPREFGLLWRIAEAGGERVGRGELLRDVWRLEQMPETNSLEVHISRLRAKLALSKAAWLVETDPEGGYRLGLRSSKSFFFFPELRRERVDSSEELAHGTAAPAIAASHHHAE